MREQVIEKPCKHCSGTGYKLYADTSTWHHGIIAGCAMTPDICDICWGSGDCTRPWLNLRKLAIERKEHARRIHKLVTHLESAKRRKK
jgi:hypothetical protein